jgi:ribosomal protein S18 acetylase RimI-like enzyme
MEDHVRTNTAYSFAKEEQSIRVIGLRPVVMDDGGFLFSVYASTRTEEMQLTDWSDEQKESFLQMQFDAQTGHYSAYYPNAKYQVIECDDVPVGRLITENRGDHFLIMDIALLPEYRGSGIGTFLVEQLKQEAVCLQLPLVLRVEFFNPAIRLYDRLGFVTTRQVNSVYQEMVWTPSPQ